MLDLNSAYSYLLLTKYYCDTCVVAEADGKIVGFVSAFQPPRQAEVIFVWQVAVDEEFRRRRLGLNMLKHLLAREICSNCRYLELTVNPSNHAAFNLYYQLAHDLKTSCVEEECFPSRLFPGEKHEEEVMLRIGPLI
ncbi:Acyl-CoA N-acyltransferase [Syntrophomonas zehnderi OL-4]|uniref:L-2,4-diaminobutyric acid acetyltransferase n=1 Tax=Syntrophomonas zehnderi OL-4 TaxID=690567 RepID=A0A0E4GDF9_9FIRM|nr:Acyl-CoA N-acyltransferase [Syntrophomonas zehnderi OL-4]